MTRLLAIDTSSAACSAALLIDDSLSVRHALAPRQHAQLILPMLQSLLQDAGLAATDLDACAFARGPGSFTGLRIAASVIQGVAFAARVPVVPVSTLAALALGALRSGDHAGVLAALDARKDEVYYGAFRRDADGLPELLGAEHVCAPARVQLPDGADWVGAGAGWGAYRDALLAATGPRIAAFMPALEPHAADVARLAAAGLARGAAVAPDQAVPVYLRDNVADAKRPAS